MSEGISMRRGTAILLTGALIVFWLLFGMPMIEGVSDGLTDRSGHTTESLSTAINLVGSVAVGAAGLLAWSAAKIQANYDLGVEDVDQET